jgi:chitinase
MAGTYFGPPPPPIPYGSHPQLNAPRRPSQPSLEASISDLTRKNAVYYPNYRVYRDETPATLNYNCISHVFYAFAHVSPDGGVFVGFPSKQPRLRTDSADS